MDLQTFIDAVKRSVEARAHFAPDDPFYLAPEEAASAIADLDAWVAEARSQPTLGELMLKNPTARNPNQKPNEERR